MGKEREAYKESEVIGYWIEWQHVCLESGGDEIKQVVNNLWKEKVNC